MILNLVPVLNFVLKYGRTRVLKSKFRPQHSHPHVRLFAKDGFSVTVGTGRYWYSFKTVQQANKKINGPKAALVPSMTFTCYLNSHTAGMVSAASGANIPPQFGSVTSVKKKLMLNFLAVKKPKILARAMYTRPMTRPSPLLRLLSWRACSTGRH